MKDRIPLYPGRVKMTPVSGQANTYDMVRADEPTQEGTPLNKATLLKDATAALYGKTDAVPDDLFQTLSKSVLAQVTAKYTKHTTLEGFPVGKTITLNEDGKTVEFYVAKHNYESKLNGTGRTLVVRKECYGKIEWSSYFNKYASSKIDAWFNGTYLNKLDANVQGAIGTTKFYYTPGDGNDTLSVLERAVFALSGTELNGSTGGLLTEGSTLEISDILRIADINGTAVDQSTRSPSSSMYSSSSVIYIGKNGQATIGATTTAYGARPAFTLPDDFEYTYYTDEAGNVFYNPVFDITDVLGNLIQISATQIVGGVQIATGSYTGTGTYGASNPNTLTFDFEPKYIAIYAIYGAAYGATPIKTELMKDMYGFFNSNSVFSASYYNSTNIITQWGTTVSFYGQSVTQPNKSGMLYKYIAIG